MPDISKIKLPSGNVYDIKDATAREMISSGISYIIAWDGSSEPVIADIPAGVKVTYNGTDYIGTLSANSAQVGAFYLVKSSTNPSSQTLDIYDEYVPIGITGAKTWEKIGDTQVNLSDVVTGVTLSKSSDTVLGTGTTITVTPSTTYLGASANGVAVGADGTAAAITGFAAHTTDTFVKSVSAETNKKLVTTTIPNVTGNSDVSIPNVSGTSSVAVPNITGNSSVTANKSTWTFSMGSGDAAETLIIGGGNGSDVTATNTTLGTALEATKVTMGTNLTASKITLGTAITAATGATASTGSGDDVIVLTNATSIDVTKGNA